MVIPDSRRTLFAVMIFLLYALFLSIAPSWNVESRWALALALARQGTTHVEDFIEHSRDVSNREGHLYSAKAPGIGLLCAPLVWIMDRVVPPGETRAELIKRYIGRILIVSLPGMLLALLVWTAGKAQPSAAVVAAGCALATPIFPYATILYGHVTAAFLVFLAWRLVRTSHQSHVRYGIGEKPALRPKPFTAGLLAGLGALVEYPAALVGIVLLVALSFQDIRNGVRFLLGMFPAGVVLAVYNLASFGTPMATGYTGFEDAAFQQVVDTGVSGFSWPSLSVMISMLLGRYRGLLLLSPWLVLWIFGLCSGGSARRDRFFLAVIPVAYVVVFSGFIMWWGGASCGMRHLIPALPFMAVAMAGLRGPWKITLVILGVLSTLFQLGFVLIEPETPEDFLFPWFDQVLPWLRAGRFRPTVISALGGKGIHAAILSFFFALAAWVLAWRWRLEGGVVGRGDA